MHAATLRRLLVFGVCGVGVASLYLVPGNARSPHPVAGPRPHEEPRARPSGTAVRDASAPSRLNPTPSTSPTTPAAEPTGSATTGAEEGGPGEAPAEPPASTAPPPRPSRTGATAFDPADPRDDEAPEPVAGISTSAVTPTGLTLRWAAAGDNVGVVEYQVVLDGYEVVRTPGTVATVRWFNDDARAHVVQVKAVDAAGNQSRSSPNLLVARPAAEPTPPPTGPTPDPSQPTPTTEPTPEPSPRLSEPAAAPSQVNPRGENAVGGTEPSTSPADEEN